MSSSAADTAKTGNNDSTAEEDLTMDDSLVPERQLRWSTWQ